MKSSITPARARAKKPAIVVTKETGISVIEEDLTTSIVGAEKAHATFSASGADRWLNCPGSIALSEKAPPSRESPYALEGTRAHEVLEFLIKNRAARGKAVIFLRTKYPNSMVIHGEMALDEIERRLAKVPGAELLAETRVALPVSEPDQFGTTDVSIVEDFGLLEVIDYKYGAGIPVSAVENPQLIYYALGIAALYDFNFSVVRLTIIQPRADIDGKFVRSWDTTVEELLAWRAKFEAAIELAKKAAKDPAKYLTPAGAGGKDYCRFCPAAAICPAIGERAIRAAQIAFAPEAGDGETMLALPEPKKVVDTIAIENLPKILLAADRIRKYLDAVETHAYHVLERGEKVPGFKLVEKRSTRKYTEDVEKLERVARIHFGDAAFDPATLKSPAQLEKVSEKAKRFVERFTSSISSGYTLVHESDPRPSVLPAAKVFEEVSEPGAALEKSPGKGRGKTNVSKRSKRLES